MKIKILSVMILALLFLNIAVLNAKPTTIDSLSVVRATGASYIITGNVLDLQSKWVNTTSISKIVSTATVQVENTEKAKTPVSKEVRIQFNGGTVGETTLSAYINPWGLQTCQVGDTVRFFCEEKKVSGVYQAKSLTVLAEAPPPEFVIMATLTPYIYEENGCHFERTDLIWTSAYMPIHYRINENTADCTDEGSQVQAAFQTWEDDTYSAFDFTYDESTAITSQGIDSPTNVNAVFWTSDLDPSYLAYSWVWYSGTTVTAFDIAFNDDEYTWATSGQSGKYDVQNAAAHEVGHVAKLNDLYDNGNADNTMFWWINDNETYKRSLYTGDSDGAQYCYSTNNRPTVSISNPSDLSTVWGTVSITGSASVSGSTISEVKYKITTISGFTYDSGWLSATYSSGSFSASWSSTSVSDGNYYLTVRAKSAQNIYGYYWVRITVNND